jgi:signal transduction histidine kinase
LLKRMPQDTHAAGEPSSAFYSELAEGLHAMAQPLTIVRGALGALTQCEGKTPQQERYVHMSTENVERVCDMLAGLQDLLDAVQFDAECAAVDLREIIDTVLEDMKPLARKSGVQFVAVKPSEPIHVIGDPFRTENALRTALKTAMSLASQGDLIRVEVLSSDGFADLVVENRKKRGKGLGSTERFSLALVQANIRSQAGVYACVEDPLHLSLKLPLQGMESLGADVACHGSSMQPFHQ